MDRLTAEDRVMLWPDNIWPQENGALAILDGTNLLDPQGQVRIDDIRAQVASRLHLVPRFRQLLAIPRRGLGGPLWVDAPTFDIAEHIGVHPLAPPADEATLLSAVEELRRRRLDRSRPLWQMWFLPGLPDNQVGMYVTMHHTIGDGIAGVATIGVFLDPIPDPPPTATPPWTPSPPPNAAELVADNLRQHAHDLGRTLRMLIRPVATAGEVRTAWPAMRELLAEGSPPTASLNHRVGADRNLAVVRSQLNLVKAIAHAHGAKVNDVLLAATAGGIRGLLLARGEPVDGRMVDTYVPVTLRAVGDRAHARGNSISQMVIPLPVGTADPHARLREIATVTATRKARARPPLGVLFRSRIAQVILLRSLKRHPVNLTSADLPGPALPMYLAGAHVLEIFPMLPLIGNVALGIGALSYAGQFSITAVADRDTYPDLDVFAAAVRDELHALAAANATSPESVEPSPGLHTVGSHT